MMAMLVHRTFSTSYASGFPFEKDAAVNDQEGSSSQRSVPRSFHHETKRIQKLVKIAQSRSTLRAAHTSKAVARPRRAGLTDRFGWTCKAPARQLSQQLL